MKNVIVALNEIGNKIATRFENINRGGCCVYASLIASHLSSLVPLRIKVVGETYNDTIDNIRKLVTMNTPHEWNKKGLEFNHVIIEFDFGQNTYHYDTSGVQLASESGWRLIPGSLTCAEATELASHRKGWNTAFDRDNISGINEIITDFFMENVLPSSLKGV